MRFLFLVFLLTLPSSAFAQSRVVNDTFREERENHLQNSNDTFQKYQEDGAVMMKERTAAAEEVDADRVQRREETDETKKQWIDDWNNASDKRAADKAEVDQAREERRTASIAAPAEWWGLNDPANDENTNDYDDMNQ